MNARWGTIAFVIITTVLLAPAAVEARDREGRSGHTDTTIAVNPGTRLELNNFAGGVVVKTWPKHAVRVEAIHSRRVKVDVQGSALQGGARFVSVRGRSRGVPTNVDYTLTVPPWLVLDLSGVSTDISVDGIEGELKAETVQGDIDVRGGAKFVSLGSVGGEIALSQAEGRIEIRSVNQEIRLDDVKGDVVAETVSGNIQLGRVVSKSVKVSTINGEIVYIGTLESGGAYEMSSHNGDIVVAIPEKANLTVTVASFAGEFSSTFPVRVTQTRKNGFVFTLGNGSGRLDLESFQGNIRLARAAQITALGDHQTPKPGFKFQFGANAEQTGDPEEEE
ncbi:MAG TPA: DUF4097 family beta strand repeat-containing protein [Candidatus Limnocylindria bacterium]|nr:DUF4097 family beta strand repeat-containing protein [Candidatus Limnocylindria bacterium]